MSVVTAFGSGTSITGKSLNTAFSKLQVQIDSLTATPVGSLIMFGGLGNAIPASFLLCDGSSLSTTTYSSLFAVVGYTYGGSAGSFNLPNLVGSYVALGTSSTSATSGVRAGVALTSGNTSVDHSHANTVSAVGDQSANHSHPMTNANTSANHSHGINSDNAAHSHGMTNNGQANTHTHAQVAVFTGGASATHSHGYFKPNSGANANTNADGAHFHATVAGTTGDGSDHSHANATVSANANHSHGTATVADNATHLHANSAGNQDANHSHTVTLANANQSVTHTHASATGALVCFIIKYQ